MKKQIISFACACLLTAASSVRAEEPLFWNLDDDGNKLTIPEECASETDATVLLEKGLFLLSQSDGSEWGAPYCLLSSAFLGNVEAQFAVAQLYYNDSFLPKNDIAAYKWALLSAIGGNKEADKLGVKLEKTLTSEDLQLANESLTKLVEEIQKVSSQKMEDLDSKLSEANKELFALQTDIDDLMEFGMTAEEMQIPNTQAKGASRAPQRQNQVPTRTNSARPLRKNDKSQSEPIFNFQDVYRGESTAAGK